MRYPIWCKTFFVTLGYHDVQYLVLPTLNLKDYNNEMLILTTVMHIDKCIILLIPRRNVRSEILHVKLII